MAVVIVIILVAIVLIAVLPQFWVQRVIARHSADRADYPGTGGEFARHILDEFGLRKVGVEETDQGDHYDPDTRIVRLSPQHYRGRSLSAVVIASYSVTDFQWLVSG